MVLEKELQSLDKDVSSYIPQEILPKLVSCRVREKMGDNSVQFQDKQSCFKKKKEKKTQKNPKSTISLCSVAMERAIFIGCESRKPHKTERNGQNAGLKYPWAALT